MTDPTVATDGGLHGRSAELARIDALLAAAREGASAALVLRGAPGIGKTALLGHARARAEQLGFTVLAASGYEGETGLPYATLADLLGDVLELREELPAVQARALGVAFALEEPVPLERFAVPAGVLSLLTRGAEERPLLAVVDDLHWVDEASREALLFAARRLREEGVAMLVATRDEDAVAAELGGLDVLDVGRLDLEDAVALVLDAEPDISRTVAVVLAERTAGNPLALREIPPLLSAAQRSGSEPLDDLLPLGGDLERAFARHLDPLPGPARRALTVAALVEGVDVAALHRALGVLGLHDDALAPAERARLVVVRDGQVTFRHPLVRAAVHHLAAEAELREAHRALGAACADPCARAWHLAASVLEPDEHVAAELAAVAGESRDRGGHVAAARAWDRAADLTPDPAVAGGRRLAAATGWLDAGHLDRALAALDAIVVADAPGAGPSQNDVDRTRARVALRRGHPEQAHDLLVAEAQRLEVSAPAVAAQAMLEAAVAHMMTGDMATLVADARRAKELAAVPEAEAIRSMADLLIGEALLAMGQSEEGDALLSASEPFLLAIDPLTVGPEVYTMAGHASFWIERWGRAERILDRIVDAARAASGFGKLVYPLAARAQMDFRRGAWIRALADADEAVSLARTTGQVALLTHALAILAEVEAGLGRTAAAQDHAGEALAVTEELGLQAVRVYALRSAGLDHLAQGRVREAAEILGEATALGRAIGMGTAGLATFAPDHVEALVRERRAEEAREVLDWFAARAGTGGTWGPAAVERCEGLLAPAGAFAEPFERALALHAEGHQPFEHARTALLYGERLRRDRQRARAREPLALALELFSGLGAAPWAERAAQELTAAGGRIAAPAAAGAGTHAVDELTPAELQIALMVAEGRRNREVASGLFLSEKTVERHLTVIYRKLDLRSRAELAASLAGVLSAQAA